MHSVLVNPGIISWTQCHTKNKKFPQKFSLGLANTIERIAGKFGGLVVY